MPKTNTVVSSVALVTFLFTGGLVAPVRAQDMSRLLHVLSDGGGTGPDITLQDLVPLSYVAQALEQERRRNSAFSFACGWFCGTKGLAIGWMSFPYAPLVGAAAGLVCEAACGMGLAKLTSNKPWKPHSRGPYRIAPPRRTH